jgi:rhodanese-related sulfurtransferase
MANPLVDPELEITPARARELLAAGEAVVVDVREPHEVEAGRIDGSLHIELERLSGQAGSLPRDRPIVFQCRLGARSAMAAQAFRAAGFDAWSMAGGLQRWHDEGLPLVPEDGTVAEH